MRIENYLGNNFTLRDREGREEKTLSEELKKPTYVVKLSFHSQKTFYRPLTTYEPPNDILQNIIMKIKDDPQKSLTAQANTAHHVAVKLLKNNP